MSKRSTQADQGAGRAEAKRTEVFISATSGDLRTVREIVKQGLLTMGCFPIEQTNFEPDYRTVLQMLETRIAQCDAVIHIVGVRYGAEADPASVPEGETRRSYTQMEVEIARKLGKKLYVFLCPEDFPYDEEWQAESDEKRELQRAYRQQVAERESLHTPVRSREDIALKVRELKFELEKLKGAIAHDRTRTFAVLAGLLVALAAISTGVWWWVAHGPQATAEKVAGQFRYDRSRMREQLATEISAQGQKRIASLNKTEDWRKINEIEKVRDQQIADLDRFLDGIEQTSEEGEASESYLTASKLLQKKGVGEALAFLEAKSSQRAELIETQKNRRDRDEKELRKLLQEELLAASLLEKQLRFTEAEDKYRKVVDDAGLWPEPRNAFAWFLIQRGQVIEPAQGNAKLREAVQICQGTLALNQRGKSPHSWAETQNNLGTALGELGTRSGGEEGRKLLQEAVAAFRSALEVRTKADLPPDWAQTQTNLGIALDELGKRSGGQEGRKLLQEAVAAYRSALEVRTKAYLPRDWAQTENDLGNALNDLGTRSGGEEGRKLLQEAVAAFRSAIEVRTRAESPRDWAQPQNGLGNALTELGTRNGGQEGRKLLQEAVAAHRSALEVYTKADLPQSWALTQNNLGSALSELGRRGGGEEGGKLLEDAVAAFRSALEVYTKADLPQYWAMTQYNLGLTLWDLGTRSGGEEGHKLLGDAVAAYRSALEVYTKADLPQYWAATQHNLGIALWDLGTRSGGEEGHKLLGDAVAADRSALEVYTKADLPQYWVMTQNNLGIALWDLGSQLEGEERLKRLREAVELRRNVVSYQPDDQSRYQLASSLGGLAFNLVLNSQFAEAQTRCEEAQRLANEIGDGIQKSDRDNLIFIQQNLAHAPLFQGHYDEALAIYRQYWDKPLHGKTFGEVTLEDFAAFDKAGLTHPDLSRMKRALGDLRSKAASP
jgi:tetratricopeptide (TPR) repeat protein